VAQRAKFRAAGGDGELAGWVSTTGAQPVLLLHGGPGLSFGYLDDLAAELGEGFRTAAFQQRGLAPSTASGPFTVARAVADVIAVLDRLDWARAALVGHSWGGHLALRVAAAHPDRLDAALAIDPLGIAGDGGRAAFEAEIRSRVPRATRERIALLDAAAERGELDEREAALESLRLVWPAYFGDPAAAPPMPPTAVSPEAYEGIMSDVAAGAEQACAAIARGAVRYGVLCGAASPLPWGQAGLASAELSPAGVLTLVPGAGHYPWLEAPGCVREALLALLA
jgi:pimeloyl-ACP methyl ester carboxylesterase